VDPDRPKQVVNALGRGESRPSAAAARQAPAPRPPAYLFYDGQCGLCRRAAQFIESAKPAQPLVYIDVTDDAVMQDFPQIDRKRAMEKVTLLGPDGRQREGYDAVTAVVGMLPRWRRFQRLMRLWPVRALGHGGYSLVGHHRHRISRVLGWEDSSGAVREDRLTSPHRRAGAAEAHPRPEQNQTMAGSAMPPDKASRQEGSSTGRRAFLREFMKAPTELGTCFTSSRPLARGIVKDLGLERAKAVIEFGPGPGPVTREIFKRIPKDCRFFAVELNAGLAEEFGRRFPGVTIFQDDAANVRALCEQAGIVPGEVDVIVSTLPFLLFPEELQRKILRESAGVLKPGGRFTTITYRMAKLMPSVNRFKAIMGAEFSTVQFARVVMANVPPAYVYRCVK
jgi:phosphatidylethanolamine/phosphatidyl-N-methylethanolamine N-methyltransferase